MAFLFLFVYLYSFGFIGFIIYNKEEGFLNQKMANCTNDFCEKKFNTLFGSMFTMLQVLTGDSWMEAVGRPAEEILPIFSFLFFGFFVVSTTWILLNIITGIILETIQAKKEAELAMLEEEKNKDQDILQEPENNEMNDTTKIEVKEFDQSKELAEIKQQLAEMTKLIQDLQNSIQELIKNKKEKEDNIEKKENQEKKEETAPNEQKGE